MPDTVTRLYPAPHAVLALEGLYLAHDLRARGESGRPWFYSNFIASLDGRIAAADPATGRRPIPAPIRDPRDWRLYLELAAQADAVLISGRRWRELCSTKRPVLECVSGLARGDLADWRRSRGLAARPDCLVLSASLDLPLPAPDLGGAVVVFTGAGAVPAQVQRLRAAGIEVVAGRDTRVTGNEVQYTARERGYRTVYNIAGPEVLHTLAAAGLVDRLYLTLVPRLLAGDDIDTLLRGPAFAAPVGLRLHQLHLAAAAATHPQLLLASFEREIPAASSSRE